MSTNQCSNIITHPITSFHNFPIKYQALTEEILSLIPYRRIAILQNIQEERCLNFQSKSSEFSKPLFVYHRSLF